MCRPALLLAGALLCAAAPAARGQSRAALARTADSLLAMWREANAFAQVQDSLWLRRAAAGRDTVRVAGIVMLADGALERLREAAALAWPVIDSFYGDAAADFSARPLAIHIRGDSTSGRLDAVPADIQLPSNISVPSLVAILLANVARVAPGGAGDPDLVAWLGGRAVPSPTPAVQRARVYVDLVTARAEVGRPCFEGSLVDCHAALNLLPEPDPFLRWYGPESRRHLVPESYGNQFRGPETLALYRACSERGVDSACIQLLRSIPPANLPQPLSADARQSLVRLALHRGGRGAYRRLLATAGRPMGDRLAAAAAASTDSLVSWWRAEVLAARPRPVTLPGWGPIAALTWVGIFGGLALRSSRWRIA